MREASVTEKLDDLRQMLRGWDCVAVAFSGGVDSSFLLAVAKEAVGPQNAIGITAHTPFSISADFEFSKHLCRELGVRQIVVDVDQLSCKELRHNPPNRCYICKKMIFSAALAAAEGEGCAWLADGSNVDDLSEYRPGERAIEELGVKSPLREVGLTKSEIRQLSKEMGIPVWDKPSNTCLATRIPFGSEVSAESLSKIDEGESLLRDLGFKVVRLRMPHCGEALIQVDASEVARLSMPETMMKVEKDLKEMGFTSVKVDPKGY